MGIRQEVDSAADSVYARWEQALGDAIAAREAADVEVQRLTGVASTALKERTAAIERAEAAERRVADLERELAECQAGHEEPDPDPEPQRQWLLGMSTEADEWGSRAAQIGHPVNVRRRFINRWDPTGLVAIARQCHDSGCLPFVSTKFGPSPGTPSMTAWTAAARGDLDAAAEKLGRDLAALGYRIRLTFHHEPRSEDVKSAEQLRVWGQAETRVLNRVRAGAGTEGAKRLILGPVDNGFWGGARKQGVTKADLDHYYTEEFLAACDVMGGDFYDGATDTTAGQPAHFKMAGFAAYFDSRGFQGVNDPGWKYDVGEWNFLRPEDCEATWAFLNSEAGKDFNCLSLFNSGANNRPNLPSALDGSWALFDAPRRNAFRDVLAAAGVQPLT